MHRRSGPSLIIAQVLASKLFDHRADIKAHVALHSHNETAQCSGMLMIGKTLARSGHCSDFSQLDELVDEVAYLTELALKPSMRLL